MSGMNEDLAAYFNTGGVSEDEIQKQAQAEMFLKLAEEEGIDIDQLDDAQVQELYDSTFEDGGDGSIDTQAQAGFAEKQAAAMKFAEAEQMGRTMAHAYVSELNKIAAGDTLGRMSTSAGNMYNIAKGTVGAAAKSVGKRKAAIKKLKNRTEHVSGGALKEKSLASEIEGIRGARKAVAKRVGGAAALGLGGAAAAKGVHSLATEKKAEALEFQSAQVALQKIAASEMFDVDEAASRLEAVITLGAGDSEKTASLVNMDEYLDVRSLELAELAGYPVEWE